MSSNSNKNLPICDKYLLSIHEAAYFGIGIVKMRRMAEDNEGNFAVFFGNRYLINRERFERYMDTMMDGGIQEEEEEDDE